QYGIETLEFSDGSTFGRTAIYDAAFPVGEQPADIVGTNANESYSYALGDGTYTLTDRDSSADSVTFTDLDADQVVFSRIGNDLVLSVPNGDALRIVAQFADDLRNRIEVIAFADGSSIGGIEIRNRSVADQKETGFVRGTYNAENYVHTSGDGSYTISDYDSGNNNGTDTLTFTDVNPDQVTFSRSGDNLLISLSTTGEVVTVDRFLESTHGDFGPETISFADGTTLNRREIRDRMVSDLKLTGSVVGTQLGESYTHSDGDGSYTLSDFDSGNFSGTDVLTFVDLDPAEVTFSRSGDNLLITSNISGDVITVDRFLESTFEDFGVEQIAFADGSTLNRREIRDRMVSDLKPTGFVQGTQLAETYAHAAGDGSYTISDFDSGNFSGTDVLRFMDINADDVTMSREGNNLVITLITSGDVITVDRFLESTFEDFGVEQIQFADGETFGRADIRSRLAEDLKDDGLVTGSELAETYTHADGDGSYTISDFDSGNFSGTDVLLFTDVNSDEVTLSRDGNNLIVTLNTSGDVITVDRFLESTFEDFGVEQIQFANGETLSRFDIRSRMVNDLKATGTTTGSQLAEAYTYTLGDGSFALIDSDPGNLSGTDTLTFTNLLPQEVNASQDGNDLTLAMLNGDVIRVRNQFTGGDDNGLERIDFVDGTSWNRTEIQAATVPDTGDFTQITGSAGADFIVGTDGRDRIIGLEGDDFVTGGLADDVYVFRAGDGIDSYRDQGDGTDVVEIEGYLPEQASYARGGRFGADLIITFEGSDDEITLVNGLTGTAADRIEQIRFTETGAAFAVTQIEGDLLFGRADDDDNLIVGTSAANVLQGFLGEDVIVGNAGDDTYRYAIGDGDDVISDNARDVGDRLELLDLNVSDIDFAAAAGENGHDLVLRFVTGRDRITITDGLRGASYGIETIAFADGTEWTLGQMRDRVIADASSDRDDVIRGFASDDLLIGGLGNDRMFGAGGDDIYRIAAGDGIDIIEDTGTSAGDVLELSGLISAEASVARLYKGSDTIVLRFATTDDEITLVNFLNEGTLGVDEIAFGDAVTWGRQEVLDALDNRAPVAETDGIVSVKQEETLLLSPADLLRNDYDADGDPLTIIAVDGGNNGVAEIGGDGIIRFTPEVGFFGPTQITYTVS
ncbi:MAG: calcium-binding protein, partial [Paracoccaceae bacterium]